jgi:outer membrane protein OmpA-like peptidoglycan-associated protein
LKPKVRIVPDHDFADSKKTKKQSDTLNPPKIQGDLLYPSAANLELLTGQLAAADDDGAQGSHPVRQRLRAANLTQGVVLTLQHTIGNAAVNRLLQREDDEEAEKRKNQVIEQVKVIQGIVDEWKTFRGNPTTRKRAKEIGNNLLSSATYLSELVGTDNKLTDTAKTELGSENIAYIIEIISFHPPAAPPIGLVFPNAVQQPLQHKYVMTSGSGEAEAIVKAIQFVKGLPLPHAVKEIVSKISLSLVEISYTNDFNWAWRRQVTVSGIKFSVGVKVPFIPGEKIGVKPGSSLGAISISLSEPSDALEKVAFWGLDDLHLVPVMFAEGSGGSANLQGLGGKLNPAQLVQFHNSDSTLSFPLKAEFKATGIDLNNANEVSMTIAGEGAGITTGQESEVYTKPLEPTLVEATDGPLPVQINGFDTGEAMPSNAQTQFNEKFSQIQEWVRQKNERVKKNAAVLELENIDRPYTLDIVVEGYASRIWQGAGNNDDLRKQKNLELSQQRADNVASALHGYIATETASTGAELKISSVGMGAAMFHSQSGPDGTNVEYLVVEDEYKNITGTPEYSENDKKSDDPMARLVIIRVTWRGYDVQWAPAPMSPGTPNPSDTPIPGPDGGGGVEGAGPMPLGVGGAAGDP